MKKRHEFPSFGILGRKYDPARLLAFCEGNGLLDFDAYSDLVIQSYVGGLKIENSDKLDKFISENKFNYDLFLKPPPKEGQVDQYKQVYVTEYNGPEAGLGNLDGMSMKNRLKRLDPSSPGYAPHADEHNYTKRKPFVTGYLAEILDGFRGIVNRTRFAVLYPNFEIAPHIDYDTDYVVRYHLPIVTNGLAIMKLWRKGYPQERHFPITGDIYFLNAGFKHTAYNRGHAPRLHLIVDVNGQQDIEEFGLEEI